MGTQTQQKTRTNDGPLAMPVSEEWLKPHSERDWSFSAPAIDELKKYPYWGGYNVVEGNEKAPFSIKSIEAGLQYYKAGFGASTNKPEMWGDFEPAARAFAPYMAFVMLKDSKIPLTYIDLDNCVVDGEPDEWAWDIIRGINSYSEISSSGKGVHIVCRGSAGDKQVPPVDKNLCKKFGIPLPKMPEIYTRNRAIFFTGNRLPGMDDLTDGGFYLKGLYADSVKVRGELLEQIRAANRAKREAERPKRRTITKQVKRGKGKLGEIKREIESAFTYEQLVKFAQTIFDGELEEGMDKGVHQTRILGNGGLLISDKSPPQWYSFSYCFGGDALALVSYKVHISNKFSGESEFIEVLETAGDFLGIDVWSRLNPILPEDKNGNLAKIPESVSELPESESTAWDSNLPSIQVNNRQTPDITNEVLIALVAKNKPPFLFIRSGGLTRVDVDETNSARVISLDTPQVMYTLNRVATYYRSNYSESKGAYEINCSIPKAMAQDFESTPRLHDHLPGLLNVVESPYFFNGKLVSKPGYCADSRLFYHNDDLKLGNCKPTPKNVQKSKGLLDAILIDFPFADQSSRANAITLMILPFVRPMISGPTPLHCVDSPTPGTGKGLLCDTVVRPFNKDGPNIRPSCGNDDQEWRKQITTALLGGSSHICFDNVNTSINSGSLAYATTATKYSDRILGGNESTNIPVTSVWMLNGNNITLTGELARRSVWIRLNAEMERPELREGFKIPNLSLYVRENRSKIVTAIITLVNNWVAQGMKESSEVFGSFERYAGIMGGILEANGIDGFLKNKNQLFERTNTENSTWRLFVENWARAYGEKPVDGSQLFKLASTLDTNQDNPLNALPEGCIGDILSEYLGSGNERSRQTKLGGLLKQRIDKVYGNWAIKTQKSSRKSQYRLVRVGLNGNV